MPMVELLVFLIAIFLIATPSSRSSFCEVQQSSSELSRLGGETPGSTLIPA